jgi:hypothetical protein
MPITYHNSASTPADNGSNSTTTVAVTPPASMQAGDLVILHAIQRGTATMSVSEAGGQAWFSRTAYASNISCVGQVFWCRFNGTWSANPSIAFTAGTNTTVVMHVLRPSDTSKLWAIENETAGGGFGAPASPFTVSITGFTTVNPSTVAVGFWHSSDDNTWGSLSGTGWVVTGSAQYRNTAGSDTSGSYAHRIQSSAGATNSPSKNQLTLGGDQVGRTMVAWYEYDPPPAGNDGMFFGASA